MRLSLLLSLAALPLFLGIPATVALPGGHSFPQDREERRDEPPAQDGHGEEAPPHDRAELEETFRKTMDGATLEGKWRLVKDGELGEERTEKYSLGEVRKIEGDRWLIEARVQFGEKDVRVPVPVRVLWAGDTPVITVTDLWLPGLGTYTARVLVYNGLYTGTWFGAGYGGLMSGRVVEDGGARSGAKGEAEEELETGSGSETETGEGGLRNKRDFQEDARFQNFPRRRRAHWGEAAVASPRRRGGFEEALLSPKHAQRAWFGPTRNAR